MALGLFIDDDGSEFLNATVGASMRQGHDPPYAMPVPTATADSLPRNDKHLRCRRSLWGEAKVRV
jgi:hypothetical protein